MNEIFLHLNIMLLYFEKEKNNLYLCMKCFTISIVSNINELEND